jgi:hypothetical protein
MILFHMCLLTALDRAFPERSESPCMFFFPSTDEYRVILNSRNKRQEERFHYCIHSERFQFSCINYGSTLAEKIEFTVYCFFIVQIH